MKNYFIYKITSPSGRIYIGQTKNPHKRLDEYKWKCASRQDLIYRSILKYGYNNHTFEIFTTRFTKLDVDLEEIKLIKKYKSEGISLNISEGGHLTAYTRRKPIIKCDLEGNYISEFVSCLHAANDIKVNSSSIIKCIKKGDYYCKGFLWIYKEDWDKGIIPYWKANKNNNSTVSKTIYQFNLEGEPINSFSSAEEAGRVCGIKATSISANARGGLTYRVGNYIFSYNQKVTKYIHIKRKKNVNI